MRRALVIVVVTAAACGPGSELRFPGTGPVVFGADDPRCVPTKLDYQPTITLVVDGGVPDAGLLPWESAEVRVEGLPPCRPLDMIFGQAVGGLAYAVFQADVNGVVSTATQAPLRGSWSGIDVDGPIYSSEGGLFVQDVSVLADWGAADYLEVTWPRRALSVGVDVLPVRGARGVYGDLYLPNAAPPFPIIVAIGGSEGGSVVTNEVARTFVDQGYLVFALSYWGTEPLPLNIDRVPLEYFLNAIEVAKEYPGARQDRIGVIGLSRGSEAALLVAASSSDVKAVVSVVGSGFSWPAWQVWSEPSWTLADAGVPFVPWGNAAPTVRTASDGGVSERTRELWTEALRLASPAAIEAAEIRVETIGAPVLLFGASDDQVWPSCELSAVAWNRLVDAGHSARYPLDELVCFPGAGHVVNPGFVGLPMGSTVMTPRDDGGFDDRGGSPKANAAASREAWRKTSAFFDATLRR